MRPVLKPALRLLWRGPSAVQLGVDPQHAVLLEGLSPGAVAFLDSLDGTRDWAGVLAAAAARGLDSDDAERLLHLLVAHGALDDAGAAPAGLAVHERSRLTPDLAHLSLAWPAPGAAAHVVSRRRQSVVLLVGLGRVGAVTARLLAAAGVGRLRLYDDSPVRPSDEMPGGLAGSDAGRPRAVAAADHACRGGGAAVETRSGLPEPDHLSDATLAVVTPDSYSSPPRVALELLHRHGVAHLLAGVRETTGVVGPLVVPGRTSCPRCHDLSRADRDPAWPAVAAQLAEPRRAGAAACETALATAVAGLAAGQVLAHLDGASSVATRDATLELRPADGTLRRRTWSSHPACGCRAAG